MCRADMELPAQQTQMVPVAVSVTFDRAHIYKFMLSTAVAGALGAFVIMYCLNTE
jgi:hypothetical protein